MMHGWNDMVGMSRWYGNIHWEQSNFSGLLLGDQVGNDRFDWSRMKLSW